MFFLLIPFSTAFFLTTGLWRRCQTAVIISLQFLAIVIVLHPVPSTPLLFVDVARMQMLMVPKVWKSIMESNFERYHHALKGRTALWLAGPPSGLMQDEAIPVPSVSNLNAQQYHPRIESRLFSIWKQSPPEIIVTGRNTFPEGSLFTGHGEFQSWLDSNYIPLDRIDDNTIRALSPRVQPALRGGK